MSRLGDRVMPPATRAYLKQRYPIRRPYDPYGRLGYDDITGDYVEVYPVTGTIVVCPKCAERMPKEILAAEGRIHPAPNFMGTLKCDLCGHSAPVMYSVQLRRLSLKSMWYLLGKHGGRLSVDGSRIV